jgi:hypothetical protein
MKVMIYSELEMLVRNDMFKLGYDPDNKEHKLKYWKERL